MQEDGRDEIAEGDSSVLILMFWMFDMRGVKRMAPEILSKKIARKILAAGAFNR